MYIIHQTLCCATPTLSGLRLPQSLQPWTLKLQLSGLVVGSMGRDTFPLLYLLLFFPILSLFSLLFPLISFVSFFPNPLILFLYGKDKDGYMPPFHCNQIDFKINLVHIPSCHITATTTRDLLMRTSAALTQRWVVTWCIQTDMRIYIRYFLGEGQLSLKLMQDTIITVPIGVTFWKNICLCMSLQTWESNLLFLCRIIRVT